MAILDQHAHRSPSWVAVKVITIDSQQDTLLGLILAVQQADEHAFSQLYDLLVARMYALAYRMMDNFADSEEVVADAFTQIWQQAHSYKVERSSVLAWCMMITRTRALDHLRKRKTQLRGLDENTDTEQLVATDFATDDTVALFESGSYAQQMLRSLPNTQRQVLALSFFKGLSHQEIANFCKVPLGTVKSHIRRALALLQKSNNNGLYHEQQ